MEWTPPPDGIAMCQGFLSGEPEDRWRFHLWPRQLDCGM